MDSLYYRELSLSSFILMLITLLVLINTVFSQNPEWKVYDTDNSDLPNDKIKSITIDPQCGIWIGTYGGELVKYDGNDWTVYNSDNSAIPITTINAIEIDPQENIWIGTNDSGLIKLNDDTWTIYNSGNSELPNDSITSFTIDNDENLWIGTENGLVKLAGENWTVYNSENSNLPNNYIHHINSDSQNYIWILDGILCLSKFDGLNWTIYGKLDFYSGRITNFTIDSQNDLWLGSISRDADYCGVYKFDGMCWTNQSGHLHPLALTLDSHENIWVGIEDDFLIKFDRINWIIHEPDRSVLPEDETITTLAIDKYDNIWIGTYGSGLIVYREGGVAVNVEENFREILPLNFSLAQNYPNPFNPKTIINYELPITNYVDLSIHNVLGQKVTTLVAGKRNAGFHSVEWDASRMASGVYYYRLQAEGFVDTKKLVLLR